MLQDDALHRATTSQANLMSGKIDRPFAFSESTDVMAGKIRAQARSLRRDVKGRRASYNGSPASARGRGRH
jgi:hypothetical protein